MNCMGFRQIHSSYIQESVSDSFIKPLNAFSLCLFLSLLGGEGSAEAGQKETSTCDICQFGAECDVDAEDVW